MILKKQQERKKISICVYGALQKQIWRQYIIWFLNQIVDANNNQFYSFDSNIILGLKSKYKCVPVLYS